jgi:hypothetical protein
MAHARLATFAFMGLLALLAWRSALSVWWLLLPAVVFVWLVRRHGQVLYARDAAGRGVAFYERGVARLEDRWAGTGERGDRFCDSQHVYANDLDLFGHGSLFELISLARTRTGEETLARWLTSPADADEIRARHEAVDELSPALDFRERLALAGTDIRAGVQTDRLLEWAAQSIPQQRWFQRLTWFLSAAVFVVVPYVAITSTWWPLAVVVALQAVVFGLLREQMNTILSATESAATAGVVADAFAQTPIVGGTSPSRLVQGSHEAGAGRVQCRDQSKDQRAPKAD